MKNFVFISPNFPANYFNFCKELKNNGLRVLGIGDAPYDELAYELKENLDEYYKVSTLENYDEVYRGVAYFIHEYGRIDWLESNNEYWLERDAKLRDDFNISTGFRSKDMEAVKFKSKMKANYQKAGIRTARYYLVENIEGCKKFIEEVGYPVIVKPDNGVGASSTYRINNEEDLKEFFEIKHDVLYIMEEYIDATVTSYDAIINSKGEPIFETGNVTVLSLLEVVNNQSDCIFYIRSDIPEEIRNAGRATVKAFGVKSRFIHFEFFTLNKDQYMGKKGDVVALEVNMRPSGGVSPDMMNYANGVNVYKIWADMIAFDKSDIVKQNSHKFSAFVGRRLALEHKMSHSDAMKKYLDKIVEAKPVEEALSGAMGNFMYIANLDSEEEVNEYFKDLLELKK